MASRRSDGAKRRDELLDAALRCFVERGIFETGIEEIRKAAGASPSSVYHLFDGRAGLICALLARTFERALQHLAERVWVTSSVQEAVWALVDGHLEWVLAHRDEARFMYQAMALELDGEGRAELLVRKDELRRPIYQHLQRFVDAGELPPWPPAQLEIVLLGPSHEACRQLLAGAPLDPGWLRETLPRLAVTTLAR
jgi:AcrR family transcriptional regulator